MKYLVLLTIAIQLALHVNCLPFPGVQIVKYRVPSKFFGPTSVTTVDQTSNSLYDFLTQIHYGGTINTIATNLSAIQSEDVSKNGDSTLINESSVTEKTTEEHLEAVHNITKHQNNVAKVDDEESVSSLNTIIEKIENGMKLLDEQEPTIEKNSSDDEILIKVLSMNNNAPSFEKPEIKLKKAPDDSTVSFKIEGTPMNEARDGETKLTTNNLQLDDNATKGNGISDSLLNAVGDLLSSILHLDDGDRVKTDENAIDGKSVVKRLNTLAEIVKTDALSKETITTATLTTILPLISAAPSGSPESKLVNEKINLTAASSIGYESKRDTKEESRETSENVPLTISIIVPNDIRDKDINEIDLKAEDAQTSFATEDTLDRVMEAVRREPSESIKSEPDVLEVISRPVSFDATTIHVMSLKKGSSREQPTNGAIRFY